MPLLMSAMKFTAENVIGAACITIYLTVAAFVAVAAWRKYQAVKSALSTPRKWNAGVEHHAGLSRKAKADQETTDK
jgi:hypothetical protein